jgi:hypothetical protein
MSDALKPEAYDEPDILAAKARVPAMRDIDIATNGERDRDDNSDLAVAYISRLIEAHKKSHYPPLDD